MSPRCSSTSTVVRSSGEISPTSMPGDSSTSIVPSARRTIAGGWPPETRRRVRGPSSSAPVAGSQNVASTRVVKRGLQSSAISTSFSLASAVAGSVMSIVIARRLYRTAPARAAASGPLPHTSPRTTHQRPPAVGKTS